MFCSYGERVKGHAKPIRRCKEPRKHSEAYSSKWPWGQRAELYKPRTRADSKLMELETAKEIQDLGMTATTG